MPFVRVSNGGTELQTVTATGSVNSNITFNLSNYDITGYTTSDFKLGLTSWSGIKPNVMTTQNLTLSIISVDTVNKTVTCKANLGAAYGGTLTLALFFT